MRLPYELLSSLANCLLNDTVFEIVKGLLEIQHVTEQHLYQQRLQFLNTKKSNVSLSTVVLSMFKQIFLVEEHEILTQYSNNSEKKVEELRKFMIKQKDELKQFDMGLVLQLDQKVGLSNKTAHILCILLNRLQINNKC
jgi:hypothetical protein